MFFSKSFGYAVRSLLYVGVMTETHPKVQLDEIAHELGAPRHFLGKVMKNLVKAEILNSLKGPYGGFYFNEKTLDVSLEKLVEITGETEDVNNCVLKFQRCNALYPCPLHQQVESLKKDWEKILASTRIRDLLDNKNPGFLQSIGGMPVTP